MIDDALLYVALGKFISYFVICYAIAQYIGNKRKIGFSKSFFISLFFTPVAGFLFTIFSSQTYPVRKK